MHTNDLHFSRAVAARMRLVGYVVFLTLSIAIVVFGYASDALNPIILILSGICCLGFAYLFLKSHAQLSADIATISQTVATTVDTLTTSVSIAYEIPPELNRPAITERIFNAAREAVDHHISENKSIKREDLKTIAYAAACSIITGEYRVRYFKVRILSIKTINKKAEADGSIYV
ncbi:MAG TPA: hypothetical protein VFO39_18615 [Candidatus Sulfotelmatobacter sp.]|nr:hypothetical protein [Candidatus Sulfotelmatobacter sp.]